MKVAGSRLYVAGGTTGQIVVYDIATRRQVASFDTGAGGFLNDLVVTSRGDVFVTDSFRPIIWHVTALQVSSGRERRSRSQSARRSPIRAAST